MLNLISDPKWLAVLITVVVLVCAVIYYFAYSSTADEQTGAWGFKDAVKNPFAWRASAGDFFIERDRQIEESKSWSDEQVSAQTRKFIFDATTKQDSWLDYRVLCELGQRTDATILEILADPTNDERLLTPTGEDFGSPEAPLNRLCELFSDHRPPSEIALNISRFLNSDTEEIRKSVAIVLGHCGTTQTLEPLKQALSDDDEYVRSYALMGLERALADAEGIDEELKLGLRPAFEKMIVAGYNVDAVTELYLKFNGKSAIDFLTSSGQLRAENNRIKHILKGFIDAQQTLPRPQLLELCTELESSQAHNFVSWAHGHAMTLLGRHTVEEDRDYLRRFLDAEHEYQAQGASQGLLASHGVENFLERIHEILDAGGEQALNDHQAVYWYTMICDAEVCNGGFSQYFLNSSGDHWPEAVSGFAEINAVQRQKLLQSAINKFPDGEPPQDQHQRNEQLADLYQNNDEVFHDLEQQYYGLETENMSVLLNRYVVDHAESFR